MPLLISGDPLSLSLTITLLRFLQVQTQNTFFTTPVIHLTSLQTYLYLLFVRVCVRTCVRACVCAALVHACTFRAFVSGILFRMSFGFGNYRVFV